MATNMKEALLDCVDDASDIMEKVDNILSDNNVEFIHNNQSEIIVSDQDIDTIKSLINGIDGLSTESVSLLLQITECKSKVYIRQLFN